MLVKIDHNHEINIGKIDQKYVRKIDQNKQKMVGKWP
jgi:hypothetical protein